MSLRNIALLTLSVCGLIALTGCKSANALRFADRTAPEANNQFAAADVQRPAHPRVEQAPDTAAPSAVTQSLRKVTQWLAFRRPAPDTRQDTPPAERSLDRSLTAKALTARSTFSANTGIQPGSAGHPLTGEQWPTARPHDKGTTSTPSLVRRSRRPPPDPAPKPPQEQLLAERAVMRNPYTAPTSNNRPGGPVASSQTQRTLFDTIESASRSWRMTPHRDYTAFTAPFASKATEESKLKFSPPDISRQRGPFEVTHSAFADTAQPAAGSDSKHESSSQKLILPQRSIQARTETMPRRADLLKRHSSLGKDEPLAAKESTDAGNPGDKHSAASARSTQWVAKTSTRHVEAQLATSHATAKPSTTGGSHSDRVAAGNASAVAKNIVAAAIASQTFAVKQSPDPEPQDVHSDKVAETKAVTRELYSAFPLTQPASDGSDLAGSHVAVDKTHADQKRHTLLSAQPVVGRPHSTSPLPRHELPSAAAANRSPTTMVPQANRTTGSPTVAASGKSAARPRRETNVEQSSPARQTVDSYHSYYRKGPLPAASSLAVRPSNSSRSRAAQLASDELSAASSGTRHTLASDQATAETQPPETIAPLIDAATYRQQLALRQRDLAEPQTAATLTAQRAAPGTWTATYQQLLQSNLQGQTTTSPPASGSTRSLSSEDAQ